MSTYWLRNQLQNKSNASTDGGDPILKIFLAGAQEERIYCPNSDEYRITADVVDKAVSLGTTKIAYSSQWCGPTEEGKRRAREKGISIIPFAGLFSFLKRNGVTFSE